MGCAWKSAMCMPIYITQVRRPADEYRGATLRNCENDMPYRGLVFACTPVGRATLETVGNDTALKPIGVDPAFMTQVRFLEFICDS